MFILSRNIAVINFEIAFEGFEDEKSPWSNEQSNVNDENKAPEVVLRRTQSFEADDKLVNTSVVKYLTPEVPFNRNL